MKTKIYYLLFLLSLMSFAQGPWDFSTSTEGFGTGCIIGLPSSTLTQLGGDLRVDFAIDDLSFLLAPTPPTVSTPIYLCQNSIALPLTATPSGGGTLNWYTLLTGGVALLGAPTPSTTTVGSTTYYVTETILGVESTPRTPLVVNVVADNGATFQNFQCYSFQILSADRNSSVYFDWSNNPLTPNDTYDYSYTIQGGALVTGSTIISSLQVFGMLPGQSATLTLSSAKYPCKPTATLTCSTPCVTTTTPNFPLIIQTYCVGDPMPTLSNSSPTGVKGTWFPSAISNVSSGTYTFTPDPILSPCAESQTLTVTVNPIASPTFSGLPVSLCENSIEQVLPTSSTNIIPITGTWGPFSSINTLSVGSTIYTFMPDSGQCVSATPTTINVTVNSSAAPTFNPIPAFCAGTLAVPLLPTISSNTPPISGVWNPATIDNTTTRDYEFTPDIGLHPCAPKTKITVTVNPNVTPTFSTSDIQCEGTGILTLPLNSSNVPQISGSWSPATVDTSILGSNTYEFTPDVGSCVISPTFQKSIEVYTSATPTFDPIPDFCSGTPSPSFPMSNEGITGAWFPTSISNNVGIKNYQFTPDTSLFPCAPIPPPLSVTVYPIYNASICYVSSDETETIRNRILGIGA